MSIVNFDNLRNRNKIQQDSALLAAKQAHIYGICSLFSLVLFLGIIPIPLILGMCAVSKAKEAHKIGVEAHTAKAMGVISIVVSGTMFVIVSFVLFLNVDGLLHHI